MSLSKRDTFVKWLDPMQVFWEDANGQVHFSVQDALDKFGLDDTEENRAALLRVVAGLQPPGTQFAYRAAPDSDEYFKQKVPGPGDN